MKRENRAKILEALIDNYSFDVVNGWAELHCVNLQEDDHGTEWWLDDEDHLIVMSIHSVRDGNGDWTGIEQETERWVYANADKMHDILWELADNACCNVWEFLERWGDLKDECSWVLESVLKREPIDYNFVRNIGWVVGDEITAMYQNLAYDIAGEDEDE